MQTYREHFSINFNIAYPVMLSQLGHIMVSVADSVMVGQLGVVPLGGVSLANMVGAVLLTFGLGISYGATPLVAAADGSGEKNRLSILLKHSGLINIITGISLFLLVLLAYKALYYLDQPKDIVDISIPYLILISASLIPFMFYQTYKQFLEGLSNTRIAMLVSVFSNVLNIAMNYVFIYGKLGFPAMGITGAGLATLIARIIMGISMYIIANKSRLFKSNSIQTGSYGYSSSIFKSILNIGVPSAFQYFFEVATFASAVVMMGWLGKVYLAAHQIAINLAAVTYMVANGIGAAAMVRVGNQLGKRNYIGLKRASNSIIIMMVIFMGTAALVFVLLRNFLPTLYIDDKAVIAEASVLLVIAGLFQLSDGLQVAGLALLRGLKDAKRPTVIAFISYVIVGLPIAYLLGFTFEMKGVGIWIGLLTGLSVAALVLLLRFSKLRSNLRKELK